MFITADSHSRITDVYAVDWYDDNINTVHPANATKIMVSWEKSNDPNKWVFIGVMLKTPKTKEVTLEWVTNRVLTKRNVDKVMSNFSDCFGSFLITKGYNDNGYFNVYPASYGIGVSVLFRSETSNVEIGNVKNALDELGIIYTTEYSDAHWVYRFRISKTRENIKLIEDFIAQSN
jgi:hypothetical protein